MLLTILRIVILRGIQDKGVGMETQNAVAASVEQTANQSGGIFSTIKGALNPSHIMDTLRAHKQTFFDIAIYGGIGFFIGFFVRRYSSFVITLVLLMITLVVLQNFNVINFVINWDWIQQHLGFKPASMGQGDVLTFVKENFVIFASGIIGFLIGLKVG
jgi:hypothetical protein